MNPPQAIYAVVAFVLGSCVGSFLNVVVWRLPRVEHEQNEGTSRSLLRTWQALSWPPSFCPKCRTPLKWYDNLPVIGWLKLGGRCRFCKQPISIRYPIVEAIVGLMFALYYLAFFVWQFGPCSAVMGHDGVLQFRPAVLLLHEHWPIYALDMVLLSGLLAASLIDAELFIIPLEIPWIIVPLALAEHAAFDRPGWPGALNLSPVPAALAAGAGLGLLISFILWWMGVLPTSFSDGGPLLEIDRAKLAAEGQQPDPEHEYSADEIRAEMGKEMLFLLPPLALGLIWVLLTWKVAPLSRYWANVVGIGWVGGLLGSVLGLLVGGFVVWLTRIAGSNAFGREAMGMGDVHLMAAVGAALGPGAATVAFFLGPFFGIAVAIYMLLTGTRRELPFGPYLSLATAFVVLFYCPIADYLSPGVTGLFDLIARPLSGG